MSDTSKLVCLLFLTNMNSEVACVFCACILHVEVYELDVLTLRRFEL